MMASAAIVAGQQTPVATEEEPHHHVLLKNDFVIVIRATLQPGESTLYHTHSHDSADVEFVSGTTTEQLLGKGEGPAETSPAVAVSADSLKEPITHRVHNVGSGPMDIFHVEFLQRPAQPSTPRPQHPSRLRTPVLVSITGSSLRELLHRCTAIKDLI
jgi:hypothetical protein